MGANRSYLGGCGCQNCKLLIWNMQRGEIKLFYLICRANYWFEIITNFFFLFILQDSKLRQIVTLGSQDTLEEKTVTVCFGSDFVNVSFINFCATRKDIAQVNTFFIQNKLKKKPNDEDNI